MYTSRKLALHVRLCGGADGRCIHHVGPDIDHIVGQTFRQRWRHHGRRRTTQRRLDGGRGIVQATSARQLGGARHQVTEWKVHGFA